jgi:zeaxanthin glucosyltransferase
MTHFGIICPPTLGHINPMAALGRELQYRGHRVTFLQIPDLETKIQQEGLDVWAIGQADYPLGSWSVELQKMGSSNGLASQTFAAKVFQRQIDYTCRDAPDAISKAGIDALLVDQVSLAGSAIAERLSIPFVTICNAMAIYRELAVPPVLTNWSYQHSPWAHLRNLSGYLFMVWIYRPMLQVLNEYRRQWQLPIISRFDRTFSPLAQLSQQTATFDFPRSALPSCFHYVGPLRNPSPHSTSFPFEQLTGQPLIYASLGSIQNRRADVFQKIASACANLDVQLVLAHGGSLDLDLAKQLPGTPLIVPYAPQYELLQQAALTITHAGLNTVLDSLSHGVPLAAIPITYEQPGISSLIRWTHTGEVVPFAKLDSLTLQTILENLLSDQSYYISAETVQASMLQSGGVIRTADIVEQVTPLPYEKL